MKLLTLFLPALFAAALASEAQSKPATYENLNATLWSQRSAEYRALVMQNYQAARVALLNGLRETSWTAALEQETPFKDLPPAIVLDLDETVIDNSSNLARMMLDGQTFSDDLWQQWVNKEQALAIPGAAEFLKFVRAHGVEVFYVTNRVCDPAAAADHTLVLLRKLQFPVSSQRLFCKTSASDTSDKSPRRARIAKAHRVLLLLGDDLNDFVYVPGVEGGWKERVDLRERYVDANREFWGTRWFMMPNPAYGSWEKAVGYGVKEKIDALRP